jgi:hypothetical protein
MAMHVKRTSLLTRGVETSASALIVEGHSGHERPKTMDTLLFNNIAIQALFSVFLICFVACMAAGVEDTQLKYQHHRGSYFAVKELCIRIGVRITLGPSATKADNHGGLGRVSIPV